MQQKNSIKKRKLQKTIILFRIILIIDKKIN